jgi:hypothetical protein
LFSLKTLTKYPVVNSNESAFFDATLGPWFGGGDAALGLHYGALNRANEGFCANTSCFGYLYKNGKSVLTEENARFTAKELEVFQISKL